MSGVAISGSRAQFWMGATLLEAESVKYGDKLNTEVTRRLGSQQIGARTEGEYETDLMTASVEALVWYAVRDGATFPSNGYGNFQFPGTLFASHPQSPTQVQVSFEDCRILGESEEYKNEAGAAMVDLTISCDQIVRNGKTLNRRDGFTGVGPSAPLGFAASVSGAVGLAGGFLPL